MNIIKSDRSKGIIALLFLTCLWGIATVIPRYLSISFTLFQQIYLRFFLGFIFALIFFRRYIRFNILLKITHKEIVLLFSRAFIYYVLGIVLTTHAILTTKISNVSFVQAMPMTALLGFVLIREKFTFKKGLLILLSFVGVLLISIKMQALAPSFGQGEIIALVSTFFLSIGMISRKWQPNLLNDKEIATCMLFLGFIFVFIISLLNGEKLPINNWTIVDITALLIGGFLNVGISYSINYGLSRVDAVLSGTIMALEPIIVTILGFILFMEIPVLKELLGGTLIIVSVYFMNKQIAKERRLL